ncbi:gfo/Idh/MocA family oxidoreductase [Bosea caraganae]|uniref:Gfo/Idh/MocA family oxidoreductase n=1 Tax=Bosea caraganae TaxID=2763117 RepID=A0A370LCW1_9HYPH|nr:Gfo/Idh/MocA family oxidoreductase [Bosea caraganae]RDJ27800.1 gfo/Idh/MocA family oxidoreductase [Bosea caraganae]RDJ29813.1 gfo/Idh/MocA family oxidoreductase [Bosea caraganae]
MAEQQIRVGIIGANPERGWGVTAHLPALMKLPQYAVTAVCTTRQESADETARRFNVPHALADWRKLVARDDIDLVIVAVKVAQHKELVEAAASAGKHVFCEWPLGLDSSEAQSMLRAAEASGVQHMVGLQGRANPTLNFIRDLVRDGHVGEVISYTFTSSLANSGAKLPPGEAYRTDKRAGATALTIAGGHSLDSLKHMLGGFSELSAILTTQHKQTTIVGTNEVLDVTSPDQLLVQGRLEGGAVASLHIKTDMYAPTGVRLEINGTDGDLVIATRPPVAANTVGLQRADLVVASARRGARDFKELEVPAHYNIVPAEVPAGPPFFTAQLLARMADAIRTGTPASPSFADALEHQRLLELIEASAESGERKTVPRSG